MVKVGERLLILVKVTHVIEAENGVSYKVAPLEKERYYNSMEVLDKDIQSCLGYETKGAK